MNQHTREMATKGLIFVAILMLACARGSPQAPERPVPGRPKSLFTRWPMPVVEAEWAGAEAEGHEPAPSERKPSTAMGATVLSLTAPDGPAFHSTPYQNAGDPISAPPQYAVVVEGQRTNKVRCNALRLRVALLGHMGPGIAKIEHT